MRENKQGMSEKKINYCEKLSDVSQPILVQMYKNVLFITNQILHELPRFVVLNRFIMLTYFIQKISEAIHVVKMKFSTNEFAFEPGGFMNDFRRWL